MNLTTIDQWEGAIEIIVDRKKLLADACEAAASAGVLCIDGPLHNAIWWAFDDLVKLIDRDGWIDWFIWCNRCGEAGMEYKDESGALVKITTARQVAEFIIENLKEEE